MKLRWTTAALQDLTEILEFTANNNAEVAAGYAERVERAVRIIQDHPKCGAFRQDTSTYEYFVPRTRLILVYDVTDLGIEIILVWHTSKNPASKATDLKTRR